MKQPKTIIKYLVNDPRICFEMTVSLSSPPVYAEQISEATGVSAAARHEPNQPVPGTGGDVFAGQGAGRSRDEARGAGTGLPGDARGREGGGIAAAFSLPRAEALGVIGGKLSERNEGEKKREKDDIMERNGWGTAPPGKLSFLPHLAKARKLWGINSSPCQ